MRRSLPSCSLPSPRSYKLKSLKEVDAEPGSVERCISLPDNQLAEIIFKYLPMCYWSSRLELVSKQFRHCVLLAYTQIESINFEKLFSLARSRNYGTTSNMLFTEDTEVSARARLHSILKKLLTACPNLTELSGFECISLTIHANSWNTMKQFRCLRTITFRGGNITFFRLADFVDGCKSLKNLNVAKECEFKYGGTLNVGSFNSVVVTHDSVRKVFLLENLSEKLTSLTVDRFGITFKNIAYSVQSMKMCPNLVSFSVCINTISDYEIFFNALPDFSKLTKLRVSSMVPLPDTFDEIFCAQLDSLKNQLRSIAFEKTVLSDELQLFLFTKCVVLESLEFENLSLSNSALKDLPKLWPVPLKKFTFPDTNDQILPLLLPGLTKLSNLTDLTIAGHLSEKWENICCLTNLQILRLDGSDIRDALLVKWDTKNPKMFEKLVSLKIPLCRHVSDIGGALFAKKAINLEILDMRMSRVGPNTISALADVAKKLTTADFKQMPPYLFDADAILRLIGKAIRLKELTLHVEMATNLVLHNDFVQFVENVKIST